MHLRLGPVKRQNDVSLTVWSRRNQIQDTFIFKNAALAQQNNFHDLHEIANKYDSRAQLVVVGCHLSKSILLPVVLITLPKVGLNVWIRDNFDNIAVTVQARREIKGLDAGQMNTENLNPVYFQGFKGAEAPVCGPYIKNNARFSFHFNKEDFKSFFESMLNAAIH
jgi:hypothetical protein